MGSGARGPRLALAPESACLRVWHLGTFTLQGLLGCELAPDNSSLPTALFALNGEEFMEFNTTTGNWSGEWPETGIVGNLWMKQPGAASKEREFLLTSCPERLLGHLERGSHNLEWKGEPVSCPSPRSPQPCSKPSQHPPRSPSHTPQWVFFETRYHVAQANQELIV